MTGIAAGMKVLSYADDGSKGQMQNIRNYCAYSAEQNVVACIISMKTAVERRSSVMEFADKLPFPWFFLDGQTRESSSRYQEDAKEQVRRFGRELGKNEVGAFKSHVRAMELIANSPDLKWLLILEDDVWLDVMFEVQRLIEEIEKRQINYIRLFAKRWKPARAEMLFGEYQLVRFLTDPHGAQAYLINAGGARAFLESLEGIYMPIDDEMSRFWINGLDIYCVYPHPVVERAHHSSISVERVDVYAGKRRRRELRFHVSEYLRKMQANLAHRLANR